MRTSFIVTTAALAIAGAASAQPIGSQEATPSPPKYLMSDGYSQPDITPGLCRAVSSKRTDCVIPEMTAGRYLIEASATATAAGEGAVEALGIKVGGEVCVRGQSKTPDGGKPWTSGPLTMRLGCVAQLVTDNALTVSAEADVAKATLETKGPLLSFRRIPWNPVQSMGGGAVQPAPAPAKGK